MSEFTECGYVIRAGGAGRPRARGTAASPGLVTGGGNPAPSSLESGPSQRSRRGGCSPPSRRPPANLPLAPTSAASAFALAGMAARVTGNGTRAVPRFAYGRR